MALNGAFNLPTEIWCNIFWYLDKTSKKNSTATCQFWYEVIRNDRKLSGYIALDLEKWPDLDINSILGGKWPALEILEFKYLLHQQNPGYEKERQVQSGPTSIPKMKKMLKGINFKQCPKLEKIIWNVSLDFWDLYHRQHSKPITCKLYCDCKRSKDTLYGTWSKPNEGENNIYVEQVTFHPKTKLSSLGFEHVTSLMLCPVSNSYRDGQGCRFVITKRFQSIAGSFINLKTLHLHLVYDIEEEFIENTIAPMIQACSLENVNLDYGHGDRKSIQSLPLLIKLINENCKELINFTYLDQNDFLGMDPAIFPKMENFKCFQTIQTLRLEMPFTRINLERFCALKNITTLVIRNLEGSNSGLGSNSHGVWPTDMIKIGQNFTKLEQVTIDFNRYDLPFRTKQCPKSPAFRQIWGDTYRVPLSFAELAKILDNNFQPKTEAEIIVHPKDWKTKTFIHIIKRPFQKTAVKELERKRKEDDSDSDESDWETDDNSD